MEEKGSFGMYIHQKRLEAGLTQKELAKQLYVTESTVSKWERGLSYPDVSMVTAVCAALGISEHEFFTACDDHQARTREREARHWRRLGQGTRLVFAGCYAVALLVCFICDLAVCHALDWFWIVLAAVGLAFCFTNLPFLVRENKLPVCLAGATVCLFLLLTACWLYTGGWWIVGGLAITAVCLALFWGWWAIWRFYGKHIPALWAAWASLWVFGLVTVIWSFTGGDWLLGLAFPLSAAGVGFVWAILICALWLPVGPWLKAGLLAALAALAVSVFNCLSRFLLGEAAGPRLSDYFRWTEFLTLRRAGDPDWVNLMIAMILQGVALALIVVGLVMEFHRRRHADRD